jgi:hypothetical protein
MKKGWLVGNICPIWTDGEEVEPRSYGWFTFIPVVWWCQFVLGEFPLLIQRD